MLRIIVENSIAFSLLCAGVWLVKAIAGKRMSAQLHFIIWAAAVLCLALPFRVQDSMSAWNLLPAQSRISVAQGTKNIQSALETPILGDSSGEKQPITPQPTLSVSATTTDEGRGWAHSVFRVDGRTALWVIWLTGFVVTLSWLLCVSIRLRRQVLRSALPELPPWLAACAQECKASLNLRTSVRIALQPIVPAPAVMGLFRPVLALPESITDESAERVRHVLLHELSHVKRGDLAVIAVLNILSAIYWFHPLVWLSFGRIRADMETACDTRVLQALGRHSRQEYVSTLLHFSGTQRHTSAQAALSLHDAKTKMKKRIGGMLLMNKTKPRVKAQVLFLVLVMLVAAVTIGSLPVLANATAQPQAQVSDTSAGAVKNGNSQVIYRNTQYGFQFVLPTSWKGYTIVTTKWTGLEVKTGKKIESGPIISVRNPKWTKKKPYQDIPVMVYTLSQWKLIQKETMSVSAAPMGPSELGRNSKYVFALPARYNYAFPAGYKEVEEYLATKPLKTFTPGQFYRTPDVTPKATSK